MLRLLECTMQTNLNFRMKYSTVAADIPLSQFGIEHDVMEIDSSSSSDEEDDNQQKTKKEYILVSKMSKLTQRQNMKKVNQTMHPPTQYLDLIYFIGSSRFLYDMALVLFPEDVDSYCNILFEMLDIAGPMNFNSSVCIFAQPLLLQLSFPSTNNTAASYNIPKSTSSKNILLDTLHKIICLSPILKDSNLMAKAQVLFCEIFTCTLLPIRDELFISLYGSYLPSVIEWLSKHCLYDLYYTHPLLTTENDNLRSRLFMSGTKLYNALHERYSRCVSVEVSKKLFGVSEEDWCKLLSFLVSLILTFKSFDRFPSNEILGFIFIHGYE